MSPSRRSRRPSLIKSRSFLSAFSLAFFAVLAVLALCPTAVKADDDTKSEYGTVIGIGESPYAQNTLHRF